MTQTLELDEKQYTTQYQVENTTSEVIPVTVKVFERIQLADGKEKLPATKDVKVFPPQLIISPGERKTIRVDWVGPKKLEMEKVYRIVAEQVPLNVKKASKKNRGGINMLLKFMNVLYVDPGQTKSEVQVVKYDSGKKLRVYLENRGTRHQYLRNVSITFKSGKNKIVVPKSELKKLEGQNILAKTVRYFDFELKTKVPQGFVGSITFD